MLINIHVLNHRFLNSVIIIALVKTNYMNIRPRDRC